MGLDMYAFTTKRALDEDVDFEQHDSDVELHYWRKHPNLHGWMEQRYFAKGGCETFNCATVVLTSEDLDELEDAIRKRSLPATVGFFFGESDGSEAGNDLAFVAKAREALRQRLQVYYTSWW